MESFGSYLKKQREAKNIRLEEIASITKIHLHNLQLLEKAEWSQLPPEPFIRGFIIAYAKYIGLDSKDTLRRFLESRQELSDSRDHEIPEAVQPVENPLGTDPSELLSRSRWSIQKIATGITVVAVGFAIAGIAYIGRRSNPSPLSVDTLADEGEAPASEGNELAAIETKVSEPSSALSFAPSVEEKVGADSVPRETTSEGETAIVEKAHEVVVEGKERTWMKIVIDDQKPRETFLKEGEIMTLTADHKIKVVLGNSTGTRVVHNGEPATGEKFSGTIRSYIFPRNARFPQDPPKRATSSNDIPIDAADVSDANPVVEPPAPE